MSRPTAFIGSRSYQLFGGEVDDILSCGGFTDILSGGAGANTFVCAGQAGNTQGVDRIVDFDVQGRDVLEFTGHSPIVEFHLLFNEVDDAGSGNRRSKNFAYRCDRCGRDPTCSFARPLLGPLRESRDFMKLPDRDEFTFQTPILPDR